MSSHPVKTAAISCSSHTPSSDQTATLPPAFSAGFHDNQPTTNTNVSTLPFLINSKTTFLLQTCINVTESELFLQNMDVFLCCDDQTKLQILFFSSFSLTATFGWNLCTSTEQNRVLWDEDWRHGCQKPKLSSAARPKDTNRRSRTRMTIYSTVRLQEKNHKT